MYAQKIILRDSVTDAILIVMMYILIVTMRSVEDQYVMLAVNQ